jgi:hypothetical protein
MSRRGDIVVECDSRDCYAEVIYRPERLDEPIADCLEHDGWARKDGKDYCPDCVKAGSEPERDEAYERAAARDRLDDFARTGGKDWT